MNWEIIHHPAYWKGTKLVYPDVTKDHPKFSQSVVVGNLIFVSGCGGKNTITGEPAPKSVEEQVVVALDKTRLALEAAGSSMANIVKTFFMIRDLADYSTVRKTETQYYLDHAPGLIEKPPAATLMVFPGLADPDYMLEFEAIGVRDPNAANWNVTYYPEFWGGIEIAYPYVPMEHAKFARTQVVGEWVVVSGCQALDHDTVTVETDVFAEQTRICLDKIKIGLDDTGGSLKTLVKTIVFVKRWEDVAAYRKIEQAYFKEHAPALASAPPATTMMVVTELPRAEFLVEIEAFGIATTSGVDWHISNQAGTSGAAESVTAGQLVYLSAFDGSDPATNVIPDEIERQIVVALDRVRTAVIGAGSSMDKIIKTTMMLTRLEDYSTMRRIETEYYEKYAPFLLANPPASTFIQLEAMPHAHANFQIDALATL